MLLFLAGTLVFLFGWLLLLVAMFRVSFWWGLFGFLFLPVQWLFILLNWGKSWRALLVMLLGMLMAGTSVFRSGVWEALDQNQQLLQQFQSIQQQMLQQQAAPPADEAKPFPAEPDEELVPLPAKPVYQCRDARGNLIFTDRPCDTLPAGKML